MYYTLSDGTDTHEFQWPGCPDFDHSALVVPWDVWHALEDAAREWVDGHVGPGPERVDVHYVLFDDKGTEVFADDVTVEIDTDHDELVRRAGGDPDCDHEWTGEGHGGCDENPGVWSVGGTGLSIEKHCPSCGLIRREHLTGSQHDPGESDTVEYEQPGTVADI